MANLELLGKHAHAMNGMISSDAKIENFIQKILVVLIILMKALIVSIR